MVDTRKCPRCGSDLLWNGRGMACIACSYISADSPSPSDRKISVPKKKPDEGRK